MQWNTLYKTLETYCDSSKKNTAIKVSSIRRTRKSRLKLVSNLC